MGWRTRYCCSLIGAKKSKKEKDLKLRDKVNGNLQTTFAATTCLLFLSGVGITPLSDGVSKVVPAHNSIILNSIWKLGTGTVL